MRSDALPKDMLVSEKTRATTSRLGSLRYGANIKTSVPKAMEKDDPMRSNGRLGRKALFSLAAMTTR